MGAKGSKQGLEEYGAPEEVIRRPQIRQLYREGDGKYSSFYEGDPLSREERLQKIMFEANENTKRANQIQREAQTQSDKENRMRDVYASLPKRSKLETMIMIAKTTVNEGSTNQLKAIDFIEAVAKDEGEAGVQARRKAIQFLEESAVKPDRLLSVRATKFLVYMMRSPRFSRAERQYAERVLVEISNNAVDSERGQIARSALVSDENPLLSKQTGGKKRGKTRKKHRKSRRKRGTRKGSTRRKRGGQVLSD